MKIMVHAMNEMRVAAVSVLAAFVCVGGTWAATQDADGYWRVTTWDDLNTQLVAGRKVRLGSNIDKRTVNGPTCFIEKGQQGVVLDLNGYTIDCQWMSWAFRVQNGSAFLIEDKSSGHTGCILGPEVNWDDGTLNAHGACLYVDTKATVEMTGGTIRRWKKTRVNNNGAGVYVAGGAKFILNGGTIDQCSAASAYGGGIACSDGTMEFKRGTISNCSSFYGGGVALHAGRLDIGLGAVIKNCTATHFGGALFVESGDAKWAYTYITGGSFTGNSCGQSNGGGAIWIHRFATSPVDVCVTGGLFANNKASTALNDVGVYDNCAPAVYGGEFTSTVNSSLVISGYSATKIGSYNIYGKTGTMTVSNSKLTAGTFTFNPLDYNGSVNVIDTSAYTTYLENGFWKITAFQTVSVTGDGGNISLKINVSWMDQYGYTSSTVGNNGLNGIPVWHSYVLGLEPNKADSLPVTMPVQNSDLNNLCLQMGGITPRSPNDTGVKIKYSLGSASQPVEADYTYGSEQDAVVFSTPLSEIVGVKYYRMRAKFYAK